MHDPLAAPPNRLLLLPPAADSALRVFDMSELIRPFPWTCGTCGQKAARPVTVDYTSEMGHDGKAYTISIPGLEVLECENCHARMLSDGSYERLDEALRRQVGLLTPEEIKHQRKSLGLSQQELADYLQVAPETVSRWETGAQIQQRAMNRHLLGLFKVPDLRAFYGQLAGHAVTNKADCSPLDEPVGAGRTREE
jgi:putative zinc finger/helix-turn-helix YgiT family protein